MEVAVAEGPAIERIECVAEVLGLEQAYLFHDVLVGGQLPPSLGPAPHTQCKASSEERAPMQWRVMWWHCV